MIYIYMIFICDFAVSMQHFLMDRGTGQEASALNITDLLPGVFHTSFGSHLQMADPGVSQSSKNFKGILSDDNRISFVLPQGSQMVY